VSALKQEYLFLLSDLLNMTWTYSVVLSDQDRKIAKRLVEVREVSPGWLQQMMKEYAHQVLTKKYEQRIKKTHSDNSVEVSDAVGSDITKVYSTQSGNVREKDSADTTLPEVKSSSVGGIVG
jgi:hypothetical protein